MKSSLSITIIFSILLAVIGYFAYPLLSLSEVDGRLLFSFALLLGAVTAGLLQFFSNDTITTEALQTLYVGNLPYKVNEGTVKELFSSYGSVHSVRLMKDRQTGKRKGFGFVEMDKRSARSAIKALNDTEFQQRTLKVREAKDKPEAV